MTQEYSIACLLDEASIWQLKSAIPFLETGNYPHVSLFQFRSSDRRFLSFLHTQLKYLHLSSRYATGGVSQVGRNVYLDIVDDLTLQAASDKLADLYFQHCRHKELLSQINLMELDADLHLLANQYGNYWIKHHYRPHVTLLYHRRPPDLDINPPVSVTLLPIGIYPIDPLGRIVSLQFLNNERGRNERNADYLIDR